MTLYLYYTLKGPGFNSQPVYGLSGREVSIHVQLRLLWRGDVSQPTCRTYSTPIFHSFRNPDTLPWLQGQGPKSKQLYLVIFLLYPGGTIPIGNATFHRDSRGRAHEREVK